MTRMTYLFQGALGLVALLLLIGSALAGVWPMGLVFIALSAAWWWQQRQGMGWETAVFLVYYAALAVAGFLDVGAIWMLPAAIAVLAAWDLNVFLRQPGITNLENESLLVQTHLRALGQVAVLALVLGSAVLLIQIRLSFWMAFVLALVAIVVLGRMMRQLVDEE